MNLFSVLTRSGLVILLACALLPAGAGQTRLEYAFPKCGRSYPELCESGEEREKFMREQAESQRRAAEMLAEQERQEARKAAEVKAITDQIGAHRAAEAERLLKMQEAANEASLAQKKSAHEQSCKARIARGLQNLCECAEYYPNKLKNATVCAQ